MNCHEFGRLLDAYVDNELVPGESAEIAQHLETCAMCPVKSIWNFTQPPCVVRIPAIDATRFHRGSSMPDALEQTAAMADQADFASRMIVTAACGSGTVIVTLRRVCRASRRAGPVRTVK